MKRLYSYIIISVITFSCSYDNDKGLSSFQISQPSNRLYAGSPVNHDNIYDRAGQLHNEILEAYGESSNMPVTVAGIITKVDSVAATVSGFLSMKRLNYQSPVTSRVSQLLNNAPAAIANSISDSGISADAKFSLHTFISGYTSAGTRYEDLFDYITGYESGVLCDTNFTENDKRVILTTTSIIRHSNYFARKRPKKNTDPEWDLLIGNIAGAIDGAARGADEAVTMALATGIAENR